jgi:Protein of unknown function (DUF2568)
VRAANDGVRFLLELCLLAAVGVWGWSVGGAAGWVLAVAAPLGVAVVWGLFVSPKARHRVSNDPWRLLLEVALFGAGVAGLALAGRGWLAVLFGAAVAVHLALTFPLGQR